MLNLFPHLITYQYFAPAVLRVAAALVFAYLAYSNFKNREHLGRIHFPVVLGGMWIVWLTVIVDGAVALALFLGYATQLASLVGAIVALKYFAWRGKYPMYFILSRPACILLLAICLSLLLTGAGLLAFDVPLL